MTNPFFDIEEMLKKNPIPPIIGVVFHAALPEPKPFPHEYVYISNISGTSVLSSTFYLWQEERPRGMTLRDRFKKKLAHAEERREQKGDDPIARAAAIIEVSEEDADEALAEHKGFKFVSKKA